MIQKIIKKTLLVILAGVQLRTPVQAAAPDELIQPYKEYISESELDMFAQLVYAEAGNQDLTGKRLVVDVVINRVNDKSGYFPDSIEEVIYQNNQFSCIKNGFYDSCAGKVTKECYDAVIMEYTSLKLDNGILYFSSTEKPVNGKNAWKYGDHWFSY